MLSMWSSYISRSVSRKLAFYIISIGLFVALTALIARLFISYQQGYPLLQKRVDRTVNVLLPPIQSSLEQNDDRFLSAQLARLTSSVEINAVRLIWLSAEGDKRSKSYPKSQQYFENPYVIEPELKSLGDGSQPHILSIELDISFLELISELKNEAIKNGVIIILEALIIAVILIQFMNVMITRHLRHMSLYASQLGIDKLHESFKLNRTKAKSNFDELDELALALNKMRIKLDSDVRERQVMELSLMAAKEEETRARRKHLAAEESNKAKSQFIATVSHEIRTPMNGIIGMIDLLSCTKLNESQKQYVETIKSSGASLTRVINDILDYSKIEAHKLELDCSEFNLDTLLDECIQLFSATSMQKNVELISTVNSTTPRHLKGDPAKLGQIILNLLGNAFKFTQSGSVLLIVDVEPGGSGNSTLLRFTVVDTGIGIAEDSQENLFKPFSQADSTITRQFGGTGLGLAIAQNLAKLMGGEIGMVSQLGAGASFWFTASFEVLKVDEAEAEAEGGFQGKRILLVNPGEIFNDSLVQNCLAWQVACKVVSSGVDACRELRSSLPKGGYDLAIVNSELPDVLGEELISQLHQISPDLKIILIQSHMAQEGGARSQANICITHPVTSVRLSQALAATFCIGEHKAVNRETLKQYQDLKVLVAEDNSVNCLVITGILNKFGVSPSVAKDGKAAYSVFVKNPDFDLIFMDCEMPLMDGFEATQKIRHWEAVNNQGYSQIVALTAHVESEHKKRVFACGMDYYLSKPITVDDIGRAIDELGFKPS